jgi:hypothetical protein
MDSLDGSFKEVGDILGVSGIQWILNPERKIDGLLSQKPAAQITASNLNYIGSDLDQE